VPFLTTIFSETSWNTSPKLQKCYRISFDDVAFLVVVFERVIIRQYLRQV